MIITGLIKYCVLISISFISIFCSAKSGDVNYDTVVEFSKGVQLKFPDFTLEYSGERTEKKEIPNGNSLTFTFHEFKISNGSENKTISWSSGTGDIAPARFDIGGKSYELELRMSEKLNKKLDEDELVIVKK
jgi:hypothetical protein